MKKKSHREIITEILSSGEWVCGVEIFKQTGWSFRNRISEMNAEFEEQGSEVKYYQGKDCNIDHTFENKHNENIFMWRKNPLKMRSVNISEIKADPNLSLAPKDHSLDEWNNQSKEERHKAIKEMMTKAGLK